MWKLILSTGQLLENNCNKEFFLFLTIAWRSKRTEREPLLPFLLSNRERRKEKLGRNRNWRTLMRCTALLRNREDELWVNSLLLSPLVYELEMPGVQPRFPMPFYWCIYTLQTHTWSTSMVFSITVAELRTWSYYACVEIILFKIFFPNEKTCSFTNTMKYKKQTRFFFFERSNVYCAVCLYNNIIKFSQL